MEATFWTTDENDRDFEVKVEFDFINGDFDYDGPGGPATEHVPPELSMNDIKRRFEGGEWEDWNPQGLDEEHCEEACWDEAERQDRY